MGIRSEVSAVLKRPVSNVAPFSQILFEVSRDSGNTQRLLRDLMAAVLTKLEELEKDGQSKPKPNPSL